MSAEVKKEIELEIAHVLFLDIVGYSKLSVNEQHARVDELNGIVRLSEQFQKAEAVNRILKIPTGDGMALVFYKSPEEPAQCAFEISRALKNNPRLPKKLEAVKKHHAHVWWAAVAIGLLLLGAVVAAFMIVSRRPTTSLTAIPEKSIAVLPFVDMSAGKDQEYFSDGISEELLNLLAKIPQLQVTARTSSFAFKGKEVAIPEIARTLHVAHVLEGSVRKAGNSVRITAQLIKAGTDTHLWSQTYDRKLDDIFAVQDEIAADVVKQLKVTLLSAAPKARTTDPEAYALYLQAV